MRLYVNAAFNDADNIPEWLKKDKNALKALNELGYDLYNLSLKPKKTGKLEENIVIYYIHDPNSYSYPDFVWIPSIYNDYHSMRNPYNGNWTDIRYIAKKNLDIRDVRYAVRRDSRKPEKEHYVDPRYKLDDGRYSSSRDHRKYMGQYKDPRTGSWSSKGAKDREWDSSSSRDKSGYVIPKPDERLASYYNKGIGSANLQKKVNDIYENLMDIKEDLFALDINTYFERTDFPGYYTGKTAYAYIFNQFSSAVQDYKSILKYIDDLKDLQEQERISNIKIILEKIESLTSKLKGMRKYM